ncbi:uncharacterized protein ARMOST_21587 [Armillaria ostoyae]|uniref:Uncharacterized protein n=1 Tax=Armillaria ostoyae TaxID=47428 RepID=A0A284SAM9_ARMOS|nr:uncharacterized protein ARMOST_21587 [Armillaria ostoyae]
MDCEKDVFCLDDPAQGVALYRLSDGVRVKTFPIEATKAPRPRQVAFAENCRAITANIDSISTVIAARSRDIGKPSRIFIWTNSGQPVAENATTESWLTWKYIQTLCIALLAMSFLYQHFMLLRTLCNGKKPV